MYKKEIVISGKKLIIETGQMAKQANGSVVVRYGDTVLLVTAAANLRNQTRKKTRVKILIYNLLNI